MHAVNNDPRNSGNDKSMRATRKRRPPRVKASSAAPRRPNGSKSRSNNNSVYNRLQGISVASSSKGRILLCNDGVTRVPYEVLRGSDSGSGGDSSSSPQTSFVICHDIFDCLDATKLLFIDVLKRYPRCQILVYNQPGQAGTTFPTKSNSTPANAEEKTPGEQQCVAINNDFHAKILYEVLTHVCSIRELTVGVQNKFHLVGIGNGVSIALSLLDAFGDQDLVKDTVKSIISINGYASIDSQLAGIFHSAKNAFSSFPMARPDLPISYLSNYIFSDDYINKVSRNLALSIHTAVLNPISLEGRIRLVDGALKNRCMDKFVESIDVPIVAVQSTENRIVHPSNVDALLCGKSNISHIWSHEIGVSGAGGKENDCYAQVRLAKTLSECFRSPSSSVAIFVCSGHAITQECKGSITGLLDYILSSGSTKVVSPLSQPCEGKSATQASKTETDPNKVDHRRRVSTNGDDNAQDKPRKRNAKVNAPTNVGATDVKTDIRSRPQDPPRVRVKRKMKTAIADKSTSSAESKARAKAPLHKTVPRAREIGLPERIDDAVEKETVDKDDAIQSDDPTCTGMGQADKGQLRKDHQIAPNFAEREPFQRKALNPSVEENGDNSNISITTPYTVKGAPLALSAAAHFTGSIESDRNESGALVNPNKVPQLNDYLTRGVPAEFIPTEIMAGPPSTAQKRLRQWVAESDKISPDSSTLPLPPPPPPTVEELESEFYKELKFEREREKRRIESRRTIAEASKAGPEASRLEYERQDAMQLAELEKHNLLREKERAQKQMQRRLEVDDMEHALIHGGLVEPYVPPSGHAPPVRTLPPTRLSNLPASHVEPSHLATTQLDAILDVLDSDVSLASRKGILTMDEFEKIRSKLNQQHLEKEFELKKLDDAERQRLFTETAGIIQRVGRGYIGRKKAAVARKELQHRNKVFNAAVLIQKCHRGARGRIRTRTKKEADLRLAIAVGNASTIQRLWRGHHGRTIALIRRQGIFALSCQRLYRGHLGRIAATMERQRQERIRVENLSALKIQCMWRIGVSKDQCRLHLIRRIASIDLQRVLRGHFAREKVAKMRVWATTEPGPARIELGLQMIQESKDEFERHRDELDGLHRAQEVAETRVNNIFRTLKESENELANLQQELNGLDHLEAAFIEEFRSPPIIAPHEQLIPSAAAADGQCTESESLCTTRSASLATRDDVEREKRKRYLESELKNVLSEVREKRTALETLETNISDMEATRERKEREFKRMQRDLMELLNDQKDELDELREKGIELETATATTAVAAAATAQKARDHEIQTNKMFHRQEELMKFQFMSMSLSYVSSLGMLKQMKNMASDATASAVSCSADTAAAAAAAATASNLPPGGPGSNDRILGHLAAKLKGADETSQHLSKSSDTISNESKEPLPSDCHEWAVSDVSRWLRKLSLGFYVDKFEEACIDGEFLLELKEEDLAGVLGMEHKLHRRKLFLARDKLKLSPEERRNRTAAVKFITDAAPRSKASAALVLPEQQLGRKAPGPGSEVVFSHTRHGRLKRLEESLDEGFDIDAKDDQGNNLLMTAVQNGNKKAVDMLIRRGSAINHMNSNGNTALHYALAYDTTGEIATYLIERGADDTIENRQGLSPYDGLGDDEPEASDPQQEGLNEGLIDMVVAASV